MLKRVMLLLITNILVIITISVITSLLGLNHYYMRYGIDYQKLAGFCAVWGMTGAFISLLISKIMAKTALGIRIIDARSNVAHEQRLLSIVAQYAKRLKLPNAPEVGIYESPEFNAFATGPSKANSLVAVSSGLLYSMNNTEIEGVIAHEMSHIANGDMVTMTLLQGVINSFALFLSRVCAYFFTNLANKSDDDRDVVSSSPVLHTALVIIFDIMFTILGSLIVTAFSRWREYRADHGGAMLAGRDSMIAALEFLHNAPNKEYNDNRAPALATLKINHQSGFLSWFATHPPLSERIKRLRQLNRA